MKKIIIAMAVICASTAFTVYADTAQDSTQKSTTPAANTDKQKSANTGGSLYDSIKSGWNDMIDAVAGPETPTPPKGQ